MSLEIIYTNGWMDGWMNERMNEMDRGKTESDSQDIRENYRTKIK